MKKIFAILLTCAMLVSVLAVSASAAASGEKMDFVATFDLTADGAENTFILTEDYAIDGLAWRYHASFKPTGAKNTYKVIEIATPEGTGNGVEKALSVPRKGFVMITYLWGNNENGKAIAAKLSVGMEVVIKGLDLSDKTVSSSASITFPGETVDIAKNLATGKKYTTSKIYAQNSKWEYDENGEKPYPDENGKSLTDGEIANLGNYTNAAWAGLHYGTPDAAEKGYSWVNVDLGGEYNVSKIELYVPAELGDGVTTPDVVRFVDGNGAELGDGKIVDVNAVTKKFVLEGEFTVSSVEARIFYGGWNFVSEIAVYEAEKKTEEPSDAPADESKDEASKETSEEDKDDAPVVDEEDEDDVVVGTDDEATDDEATEDETPATGDSSAVLYFAIIALVAMAGSAVVVKTRK